MKWEHAVVSVGKRTEIDGALDQYSNEGWELVTVTVTHGTDKQKMGSSEFADYIDRPWSRWDMFFKRPKANG